MSNSLRPHRLYSPWNSLGQNTGVGSLSLFQGIFPTQGLNPGLPNCRWILYQLSHKGSPWKWSSKPGLLSPGSETKSQAHWEPAHPSAHNSRVSVTWTTWWTISGSWTGAKWATSVPTYKQNYLKRKQEVRALETDRETVNLTSSKKEGNQAES